MFETAKTSKFSSPAAGQWVLFPDFTWICTHLLGFGVWAIANLMTITAVKGFAPCQSPRRPRQTSVLVCAPGGNVDPAREARGGPPCKQGAPDDRTEVTGGWLLQAMSGGTAAPGTCTAGPPRARRPRASGTPRPAPAAPHPRLTVRKKPCLKNRLLRIRRRSGRRFLTIYLC